ncbi:hypothetical protein GM415_08625 [Pseudodesulfovibrio cashew]|uniref:Uncharacterized protein n=1 Tax=Pseudodesulfovibrio cashew TaxID=2678688 RepID=A0A6I6JG97_9BACT|nr:hypothetical protein [Pseudodesulfovibrio cashew]QGY40189.1 hypothetical protein GM415_08625 [Pseudodesulfovibrio cashew]
MPERETRIFTGSSGERYRFAFRPKQTTFPDVPGVCILAYTHPRGHRAGFEAHPLAIAGTTSLKDTLAAPDHPECLANECWNSVYLLPLENARNREAVVDDLRQAYAPPCGSF